jgi:hypothetical protein
VGLLNVGIRLVVIAALTLALTWSLHALAFAHARRFEKTHWTERARALWPLRSMMSFAAIGVAFVAALAVQSPPVPRPLFAAPLLGLIAAVIAGSLAWWPRLALDVKLGALTRPRSHLREALGVSLLFFPFVWVLAGLLLTDLGDEPFGIALGAGAGAVALALTGLGATALLARELGLLLPASKQVDEAVARAARKLERGAPRAFELEWGRASAAALPVLGWVLFTRRALDVLDDAELEAVALHEISQLRESRWEKAFHVLGQLTTLPLAIGVLYAEARSIRGLVYGTTATTLLFYFYGVLNRRIEQRAEAAGHQGSERDYAAALEALYRANLTPAVLRSHSHASLYERSIEAGKTPEYPRPAAPRSSLRYLALPILPLLYLSYVTATDLVASTPSNPEHADTAQLYVGIALGNDEAEQVLTARWAKEGRSEDALSQLRSTARFGEPDWRWSRIFFLEMQRGNCAGALQTLDALSLADPSAGQFDAMWKARCGRSLEDP